MPQKCRVVRIRRGRVLLLSGLACVAFPGVASASAVGLAGAGPFAVLGGASVTNTGPSVLNGELGVASGTALTGFGLPAVVNGAVHDDDAVAVQAQNDLTTAYSTAAAQPVAPADVLTGRDLGGLTLTPGAYGYASSAQLTGTLTLDAQGDPNAQFVFEIASTLTTASASSVVFVNGASPCNVFWQVGTSATLGSTTTFAGNLLAAASISVGTGSSVQGRLLASTGTVALDDDTVDNSGCATPSSTPTPTPPATGTSAPGTPTDPSSTTPPSAAPVPSTPSSSPTSTTEPTTSTSPGRKPSPARGSAPSHTTAATHTHRGVARLFFSRPRASELCNAGRTATVSGQKIKRVVFSLNGHRLGTRAGSPFQVHVPAQFAHAGRIEARITFSDGTPARTLTLADRTCAAVPVHPLPAPSTFTG